MAAIGLVDSHTHLQDEIFNDNRKEIIARAREEGVEQIFICGEDISSSQAAIKLAQLDSRITAMVGFHPHNASEATIGKLDQVKELARNKDVCAIGEIGLDFYRNLSPPKVQHDIFESQLSIAAELGLPVSIHSRNAESELRPHLKTFVQKSQRKIHGILHCFNGNLELALEYYEQGFLISFAGPLTYPKNSELREMASQLPKEALLLETDSPALPPQRHRGKTNEPSYIKLIAEVMAVARDISLMEISKITTTNALQFLVQHPNKTKPI